MSWKEKFPLEDRYFEFNSGILYQANALELLRKFPDNVVDTVITDPPYGLSEYSESLIREVLSKWLSGEDDYIPNKKGFMNEEWDAFVPPPALWREIYRVMKPGGSILVFSGTRTYDLMVISLRLAGFRIRDTIMWLYGQGFPKSMDISKQIAKKIGGNCPEVELWKGYGTALKPAYELIILAMKPNEGNYADNALKWRVAGLNIDGGRIDNIVSCETDTDSKGRFPANVILECICEENNVSRHTNTECVGYMLDKQAPTAKSWGRSTEGSAKGKGSIFGLGGVNPKRYDMGGLGASRFFYCAKIGKEEREKGNVHLTVKPIKLVEYLVKLILMPNLEQIYLDPFLGSGTTAIACERLGRKWIGIEKEEKYCEIAKKRILEEIRQGNLFKK